MVNASISHNVITKVSNPTRSSGDKLVARVLGYNRQVKTAALSWGCWRREVCCEAIRQRN